MAGVVLFPLMRSIGRALQALRACCHSLCGWLAYRVGCRAAARRHFERVLVLRGADFRAYVHLGRIAFDTGDYAGWRREFEHARRADPYRFARLRHPFELFEPRLAGTDFDGADFEDRSCEDRGFDDTGARATWRSLRPLLPGRRGPRADRPLDAGMDALLPGCDASADAIEPRAGSKSPGANPIANRSGSPTGGESDAETGSGPARDDCGSAAERLRFRKLGPIVPSELARCDLDELARKLSG